eukprot:TRINITY_DN3647_c0_g1_i2.p1 TRINITY_DN3647_c0_g1~~TRINITY_DN3647_c0_g1_i2.p1  ORF type:complete len:881 (+),score=248.65 TRINITY_DN3647_c0_g1_i2:66-2708(+)
MSKTEVSGPGIQAARIGSKTMFTIKPKDDKGREIQIGLEQIKIQIGGPGQAKVEAFDNGDGTYDVEWEPTAAGRWRIVITIDGKAPRGSPFIIEVPAEDADVVSEASAAHTTAVGNGLDGSIIPLGSTMVFTIIPKDENDQIGRVISGNIKIGFSGPAQAKAAFYENDDGTYDVEWETEKPGIYSVSIKLGDADIVGSPYSVIVQEGDEPVEEVFAEIDELDLSPVYETVKASAEHSYAYGDGLQAETLKLGAPNVFFIRLMDGSGQPFNQFNLDEDLRVGIVTTAPVTDADIDTLDDGLIRVSWTPPQLTKYELFITLYGHYHIKGSPFQLPEEKIQAPPSLPVVDHDSCTIRGDGLTGSKLKVKQPAIFKVIVKDKNGHNYTLNDLSRLEISISGPKIVLTELMSNEEGSYDVKWIPPEAGKYKINVKIDGVDVRGSPLSVEVPKLEDKQFTRARSKLRTAENDSSTPKKSTSSTPDKGKSTTTKVEHKKDEASKRNQSSKDKHDETKTEPKRKDKHDEVKTESKRSSAKSKVTSSPKVDQRKSDTTRSAEKVSSSKSSKHKEKSDNATGNSGSRREKKSIGKNAKEKVQGWETGEVEGKIEVKRAIEQPQVTLKGAMDKAEVWEKGKPASTVEVKKTIDSIEPPPVEKGAAKKMASKWDSGGPPEATRLLRKNSAVWLVKAGTAKDLAGIWGSLAVTEEQQQPKSRKKTSSKSSSNKAHEQPTSATKAALNKAQVWEKGDTLGKVEVKRSVEQPSVTKAALNKVQEWEKGDTLGKIEVKRSVDPPPMLQVKGAKNKAQNWEKGEVEGKIEVKRTIVTPRVGVAKEKVQSWESRITESEKEKSEGQKKVSDAEKRMVHRRNRRSTIVKMNVETINIST